MVSVHFPLQRPMASNPYTLWNLIISFLHNLVTNGPWHLISMHYETFNVHWFLHTFRCSGLCQSRPRTQKGPNNLGNGGNWPAWSSWSGTDTLRHRYSKGLWCDRFATVHKQDARAQRSHTREGCWRSGALTPRKTCRKTSRCQEKYWFWKFGYQWET